MNEVDVIGVAWFNDSLTYRTALEIFTDPQNMPATYKEWKAIADRQCELIKRNGNIAIRADIDPDTFAEWCNARGFLPNAQGRTAFANHVALEYRKTGKGTVIE